MNDTKDLYARCSIFQLLRKGVVRSDLYNARTSREKFLAAPQNNLRTGNKGKTMFEHSTTTPCWRITDPNDPLSAAACEVNRGHVNLAVACTPEMNECVIDVSTRLAVRLGLTEYRAVTLVEIGHMFRRFPTILELARTGAYSLDLLRCMAECLSPVKADVPETFEEKIFKAISPTVPNQAMLARATIRGRIEQVIRKHDPQALPEESKDTDPGSSARLDIDDRPDTTTVFFLTLPKLEGLELQRMLNNVVKNNSCSRAEALMRLVRRQTKAEITLNLYQSTDQPDAQIWAAGGWASSKATQRWKDRVTHVQFPGTTSNEGYSPTPLVRASVEGRDGTCRFPGCSVPAHKCQLDTCSAITMKTHRQVALLPPQTSIAFAPSTTTRRRLDPGTSPSIPTAMKLGLATATGTPS